MPGRVLVVDDEESTVQLVSFTLARAGFVVLTANSGEEALAKVDSEAPDLVVLDVMLPGIDGFEVCKELRRRSTIPIVLLTARDDEIDRVVGFEIGADDYVAKPFSPRELVGRIKAILRRSRYEGQASEEAQTLQFGPLAINPVSYVVTHRGEPIHLTPTEFQILKVLASNAGRVFSRKDLVEQVIGKDHSGDIRTVDVHMRHLRAKIEENPTKPSYIETVRGVGYKFSVGH